MQRPQSLLIRALLLIIGLGVAALGSYYIDMMGIRLAADEFRSVVRLPTSTVPFQKPAPVPSATLSETNPPLGVDCAVEFRAPLPHGWPSFYLTGKLKAANAKWLVLTNRTKPEKGDVWIPRENVLFVVTGEAAKSYKGMGK